MGSSFCRIAFCLLVVILDQLTKLLAVQELFLGRPVPVIEGVFNFTLVYNPGAAFGMFGDLEDSWRRIILGGVSIIALVVVLRFMKHEAKGDPISQYALTAILAGAVGNLIDRFRLDAVVDFLDFYLAQSHFPAFNVADSAISCGVAILIWRMLFPMKHAAQGPDLDLEAAARKQSNGSI